MLTVPDEEVPDALHLLEATAQRLRDAARRNGVSAAAATRMLHLADDLSSHALAARVLVTSGASRESLNYVLDRAVEIVDHERDEGGHAR